MLKITEGVSIIQPGLEGYDLPEETTVDMITQPEDHSLAYKLEVTFYPRTDLGSAFLGISSTAFTIVAHAATHEALTNFVQENRLKDYKRLRSLTITGPEGEVENYRPRHVRFD